MKKNKKKRKIIRHNKSLLIVNSFIVLILLLGIGYSVLSTTLHITGSVKVDEYLQPTLYNVLKREAKIGTYAKEYTGNHNDSMDTSLSTEKIYHWYAPTGTEGNNLATDIQDKWNVLFAGHCWQMYRTTDTGGVRLIYNGAPINGQCTATGIDQSIGTSKYNELSRSPADAGYMYNTRYESKYKAPNVEFALLIYSLSTSFWYADSVTWNSSTNKYELQNPFQVTTEDELQNLIGKYTLRSTNKTDSMSIAYYITAFRPSNSGYLITLTQGNDLVSSNSTYTYGDSYTDNGNGTYTINNPSTIQKTTFFNDYSNLDNKYVCKNATNNNCSDLWFVLKTDINTVNYKKISENYKYSSGFTYNSGTNTYTLNSDSVNILDITDSTLNNYHYTCWNLSGECDTISYIHYIESNYYMDYIELTNGKNVEDSLDEMLFNDDINTTNSSIKTTVDNWYQSNLIDYTSSIEDSIYCNDRSIKSLGGWDSEGGNIKYALYFTKSHNITNIKCENEVDKFSINNPKATLDYPIGIITKGERNMLNNIYLSKTGQGYFTMSPNDFGHVLNRTVNINSIGTNGSSRGDYSTSVLSVRPVISLKPGTKYSSGTGTKNDPYVVNTFRDDSWETIVSNVQSGNTDNYHVGDTKEVDLGALGTHTLRIANKSTPEECSTNDFSQTACGFVLEFADVITTHRMNATSTNVGGWPITEMRTYLNNDIYNAIPTELKNGIINTKVVSNYGYDDTVAFVTTDKLYLLNSMEIYHRAYMSGGDFSRQLDYYYNTKTSVDPYHLNTLNAIKKYNNTPYEWWMRLCAGTNNRTWFYAGLDGAFGGNTEPINIYGVSPAFRIG